MGRTGLYGYHDAEMPRWQEELLWDLELLSDPELDQLGDTFTMLGW